jgi:hypothetical protein
VKTWFQAFAFKFKLCRYIEKESGKELTCRMIKLLLVIPVELRTLRSSGVAKCMQTRFATHPKPVGLPPFHVTLFCSHKTRFN